MTIHGRVIIAEDTVYKEPCVHVIFKIIVNLNITIIICFV